MLPIFSAFSTKEPNIGSNFTYFNKIRALLKKILKNFIKNIVCFLSLITEKVAYNLLVTVTL